MRRLLNHLSWLWQQQLRYWDTLCEPERPSIRDIDPGSYIIPPPHSEEWKYRVWRTKFERGEPMRRTA